MFNQIFKAPQGFSWETQGSQSGFCTAFTVCCFWLDSESSSWQTSQRHQLGPLFKLTQPMLAKGERI